MALIFCYKVYSLNVGELDSEFNPNVNSVILGMDKQADGKILLAGFFSSV